MRYGPDPELLSGFQIVWMANELVGRYGVFVSPGIPSWWENQQPPRPYSHQGQKASVGLFQGFAGLVQG